MVVNCDVFVIIKEVMVIVLIKFRLVLMVMILNSRLNGIIINMKGNLF